MNTANKLFIVDLDQPTAIDRLPKSHKAFKEAWVRDLIFNSPELLPVDTVLPDAGFFVPLGTEVRLKGTGKMDILGVTTGGYPVVVETKLWKNQQARREVLAQTIDYVKEVAKRDYAWFDKMWAAQRTAEMPESLFAAAAEASDDELDEVEFIDRIDLACRKGNILSFIVGDGIHHGLAEMIAHLGRDSSHLRYSLSLLEMKCFELPDGTMAVLPSVVREVTPVERAYIRIEAAVEIAGEISVTSVALPEVIGPGGPRPPTLTEDEYWTEIKKAVGDGTAQQLAEFVKNTASSAELELVYKQKALMMKVPDPDDVFPPASVFALTSDGKAYNTRHGIKQAKKRGVSAKSAEKIFSDYYQVLHDICPGFRTDGIHHLANKQYVPVTEFKDKLDGVADAIQNVANALRDE